MAEIVAHVVAAEGQHSHGIAANDADGTGSEYFNGDTWEMTWTLDGTTLTLSFPETGVEEYEITLSDNTLVVHAPAADYEYNRK